MSSFLCSDDGLSKRKRYSVDFLSQYIEYLFLSIFLHTVRFFSIVYFYKRCHFLTDMQHYGLNSSTILQRAIIYIR